MEIKSAISLMSSTRLEKQGEQIRLSIETSLRQYMLTNTKTLAETKLLHRQVTTLQIDSIDLGIVVLSYIVFCSIIVVHCNIIVDNCRIVLVYCVTSRTF